MAKHPAINTTHTTATTPPHWSPQQQTARMLALCEAQLEAATHDSDFAVNDLVQAFTQLIETVRILGKITQGAHDAETALNKLEAVRAQCGALSQQVAAATVAFQFYDKLSQRLGHVRYSLSTLALFICDVTSAQKPEHWEKLVTTLGRLYRTSDERAVFDAIAGTLSISTSEQTSGTRDNSPEGSVELF